jgi:hypothetical protein
MRAWWRESHREADSIDVDVRSDALREHKRLSFDRQPERALREIVSDPRRPIDELEIRDRRARIRIR